MSRDTLIKSILILLLAEALKEAVWKGRIGILELSVLVLYHQITYAPI